MGEFFEALVLAFLGAILPAFLFRFDGRRWLFVGLSGVLGWGSYLLGISWNWGPTPSLFAGACIVAVWSEGLSFVLKTPVPAVLVGGVFPLVPGLTSFQALEALLRHQTVLAGQKGGEALAAAVAIALGVLTVSGLARLLPQKHRQRIPDVEVGEKAN